MKLVKPKKGTTMETVGLFWDMTRISRKSGLLEAVEPSAALCSFSGG